MNLEVSSGTVLMIASFRNARVVCARNWLKADHKNKPIHYKAVIFIVTVARTSNLRCDDNFM
jgi:hypothetical protein